MEQEQEVITTTCRYDTAGTWRTSRIFCGKPATEMVTNWNPKPDVVQDYEPRCRKHMAPVRRSYRKDRIVPVSQLAVDLWAKDDIRRRAADEEARTKRESDLDRRRIAATKQAKEETAFEYEVIDQPDTGMWRDSPTKPRWVAVRKGAEGNRRFGQGAEVVVDEYYGEPRLTVNVASTLTANEARAVIDAMTKALAVLELPGQIEKLKEIISED